MITEQFQWSTKNSIAQWLYCASLGHCFLFCVSQIFLEGNVGLEKGIQIKIK